MVMQLLHPAWLWGLLGLAVPILIHLLHKRSRRVLLVGSLQPFRGGEPVQARRLRPNELWLLLLRCLLLLLFVLLLAEPVLYRKEQEARREVYVAPELVSSFNRDSAIAAGFEPHLLQPGLALLEENSEMDSAAYSFWDVFQEIDTRRGTSDTAWLYFLPNMQRFLGKRPALSKAFVALPVQAQAQEKPQLFRALLQDKEQLLLNWWVEEAGMWRIGQRVVPLADSALAMLEFAAPISIQAPDTLQILLQHSEEYTKEAKLWLEAIELIDRLLPATVLKTRQLPVEQSINLKADVWVWLAKQAPPAIFGAKGEDVRFRIGEVQGKSWFLPLSPANKQFSIQYRLQEQQNNRQRLASFLPQLMERLPLPPAAQPPLLLSEEQWQPEKLGRAASLNAQVMLSLTNWLLLALLILFILERWLSLQK